MAAICEMCPGKTSTPATVYCPADSCYLCTACDHEVHSANRLASRHVRRQLVPDDITDGSSINDDSDSRVPGVSSSTTSKKGTSVPTNASTNNGGEAASTTKVQIPPLNDVSVTFEDAAEYDFCFDSIAPRMAPLNCGDYDNLFSGGKLAKSFYPDLSWDSVVSDAFEHVAPDVELSSHKDAITGKLLLAHFWENGKRSSASRSKRSVKNEQVEFDFDQDLKMESDEEFEVCERNFERKPKMDDSTDGCSLKMEPTPVDSESTRDRSETNSDCSALKRKAEGSNEKGPNIEVSVAGYSGKVSAEDEAKLHEQRKKRRMAALARFRSKRANRSFTKKVRYECRKQLADSRPRVKGRFVRKVEMALFRKYGAMYRDHLDELKDESNEQRISSM